LSLLCHWSNAATVARRIWNLNSEGGSGRPTSECSDQLFDACGAEPVLDLPHGGVVGRAQPRTSSIAQLSERLRARKKVRVEVRKLHQYVWAGQRHPSRRPGSSRCGTVASRGDGTSSRAPRCGSAGERPGAARAGGRGGGVGRGCRTGRDRRRNRSSTAPGAAEPAARRSGRRPAVAPVSCAGCRPLSWVSTVMSRSEVAVAAADK